MSSMSMRKPSFFRSFRVWIVLGVALYLYMHITADNKAKDVLILWCIPSFFILLSAYMSYLYKKLNASTFDKHDNNGTWSHEFKDSKMLLDTHTRKLTLKNGKREKTYSFDQVVKWYYQLESGGEIVAFDLVSILGATGHNQSTKQNNFENSGFFIRVNDIEFPTWQIKFYPREGKFHHLKGIKDTEEQLQRWCQIFDNVINGEMK
jgi:hypothetical protein